MKFKVGDKVRLIANTIGSSNEIGFKGLVTETITFNGGYRYRVSSSGRPGFCDWSDESDLELVEERKIIGYKLVKPEYKEAVKVITEAPSFHFVGFEQRGKKSFTSSIEKLEKAGVLDLWFEPVYEEKKEETATIVSVTLSNGVVLSLEELSIAGINIKI